MQNNIGEARREYASRVGKFTQEDAAQYFDVSLSTYKKWEQGQGKLKGDRLRKIAEKYGVTTDYLLSVEPHVSYAAVSLTDDNSRTQEDELALTNEESELISLFRVLPESGRHAVLLGLRDFASSKIKDEK